VVLISHDRELMARLCDEYVGLDGRGGSALYGSVSQWLAVLERAAEAELAAAEVGKPAPAPRPAAQPAPKPRKLTFREQQEYDGMEAAILAAEETLTQRQAEVERAATAGHVALAEACRALEEAQHAVERLYARWQELESKRQP
jgi:ATP-binding cassette subfamily F protein uup